jgi:dihydroorotate dehydrogenase
MGFNNQGASAMAERLARLRGRLPGLVLGGNIGKSRTVSLEKAHEDYLFSATLLAPLVDYLTINVSSPNTPNLRHLQDKEPLRHLLRSLKEAPLAEHKPLFLKLAPDLSESQLEDAAEVVREIGLSGVIATNTTVERVGLRTPSARLESIGAGGLSGYPLKQRSVEVLQRLRNLLPTSCCLISVGGIESGWDVLSRLEAGARAVQVYTGLIYGGPLFAFRLRKELCLAMAQKGYRSLAEIAP